MSQAGRSFVFFSRSSREKADLLGALSDGYLLMIVERWWCFFAYLASSIMMLTWKGAPTLKRRGCAWSAASRPATHVSQKWARLHYFHMIVIIITTIMLSTKDSSSSSQYLVSNFSSAGGGSSTIFAGGESEVIININSFNICKHLENHHHHDHDHEHHHLPGSITTCHCAHWKPPPPSTRTTRAERRGSVYLETH